MADAQEQKRKIEMAEWPLFAEVYKEVYQNEPDPKMMDDWQHYQWFRRGQSNAGHLWRQTKRPNRF